LVWFCFFFFNQQKPQCKEHCGFQKINPDN